MSVKVSVALATYNGAQYLRAQLESIARQTVLPDELVVSDDGSSDETAGIVREFAAGAPFDVRFLSGPRNLGFSQNFNRALQACSGETVFLCDQDDVWLPEKIQRTLLCLDRHPEAVLVIHDLAFCREDLTPIGQTILGRLSSVWGDAQHSYVAGMATAIRGGFLRLCLPVPDAPGIAHDSWLHECALAVQGKVILPEVLALWRRHQTNATKENPMDARKFMGRIAMLWSGLQRALREQALPLDATSSLAAWLDSRRAELLAAGWLDEARIDALIAQLRDKTVAYRERRQLLHLPRWQRLSKVIRLYRSGNYQRHFNWWTGIKDMVQRSP